MTVPPPPPGPPPVLIVPAPRPTSGTAVVAYSPAGAADFFRELFA